MAKRGVEFGTAQAHGAGGDGAPAEQTGERAPLMGGEIRQGELVAQRAALIAGAQPLSQVSEFLSAQQVLEAIAVDGLLVHTPRPGESGYRRT